MSTLVISLKTDRQSADVAAAADSTKDGNYSAAKCRQLLKRWESSVDSGSLAVSYSSSDPVRASGTLTCVYGTLADTTSTVVIGGVTLTCVTGTSDGVTQFKKQTDLATTIANLAATINANTTINKFASAAVSAVGVVTITAHSGGVIGNFIPLVGGTGATASAAYLASGAGGAAITPVTFSKV